MDHRSLHTGASRLDFFWGSLSFGGVVSAGIFTTILAAAEAPDAKGSPLDSVTKFFEDGGMFMWVLLGCSIIGVSAVIFKLITLSKGKVAPSSLEATLRQFSQEPSEQAATGLHQLLQRDRSELGSLCKVTLEVQDQPREEVYQSVQSAARESVVRMQSGMSVLEVIITIAPLIGLLGTVSGLVSVFNSLDGSESEHLEVGRGIAQALNTTIGGLAVAVPAVVAHKFFERKIDTLAARLEVMMERFISAVAGE